MTYRLLSAQALAEQDYDSFLTELEKSLTDGRIDPNDVVRETLFQMYFGALRTSPEDLPWPRGLQFTTSIHATSPPSPSTTPTSTRNSISSANQ